MCGVVFTYIYIGCVYVPAWSKVEVGENGSTTSSVRQPINNPREKHAKNLTEMDQYFGTDKPHLKNFRHDRPAYGREINKWHKWNNPQSTQYVGTDLFRELQNLRVATDHTPVGGTPLGGTTVSTVSSPTPVTSGAGPGFTSRARQRDT